MSTKPTCVLIIDDLDDETFGNALEGIGLKASALRPEDVTQDDVTSADLVLVDYKLDDWPDRQEVAFPFQPRDGLALAAVLRRQVHDALRTSPTAFAIRTGRMEDLASPLPPESRAQVLSRINNLEWVFEKSADSTAATEQVKSLADAVRLLPQHWPVDDFSAAQSQACDLLGLRADTDPELLDDILDCSPPLHSMSQWSHGLAFLRWFLHRILPYPCFLLDRHYLAARLRISSESLDLVLRSRKCPLHTAAYSGFLTEFLGRRWWRARIEKLIWESTNGDTLNGETLRAWLSSTVGKDLQPISDQYPVVCLDENHRPLDLAYPMDQCVRIRPDDWPSFADQAWTREELARQHNRLGSLVISADRGRVS